MYKPTLAELEAIKTEYKIVPVSKEIFADLTTPIKVLKILKNISDNVYLFESVENTHHWGRYSFLGFNPSLEISCKNHLLKIKKASSNEIQEIKTDNIYRRLLADWLDILLMNICVIKKVNWTL